MVGTPPSPGDAVEVPTPRISTWICPTALEPAPVSHPAQGYPDTSLQAKPAGSKDANGTSQQLQRIQRYSPQRQVKVPVPRPKMAPMPFGWMVHGPGSFLGLPICSHMGRSLTASGLTFRWACLCQAGQKMPGKGQPHQKMGCNLDWALAMSDQPPGLENVVQRTALVDLVGAWCGFVHDCANKLFITHTTAIRTCRPLSSL